MNANIVFGITTLALALALTLWFIFYIRRQKKARLDREQRLRDIERTHREHQAEVFRLQQERFGRPAGAALRTAIQSEGRVTRARPQGRVVGMHPGFGVGYGGEVSHHASDSAAYLSIAASQVHDQTPPPPVEDDDRRRHHHTPHSDPVIESSAHDHSSHSHDSGGGDSGGGCDCGGGGSD